MSAIALRRGKAILPICTLPPRTFEGVPPSHLPLLETNRIAEINHMKDAYDQYVRATNMYDRILRRLSSYRTRWYTKHCLGLLGIEGHWGQQLPLFFSPPLNLKHLRKDAYEYSNNLPDVDPFAREAFEVYLITSIARLPCEARVLTNVLYYPISESRLVTQLSFPCRQIDLEDPAATVAYFMELPFQVHVHYPEDSIADADELPFQAQIRKAIATVPVFAEIPWSKINLPLLDETDIEIEEDLREVDERDMQVTAQQKLYLLENSGDSITVFVPDEEFQPPHKPCSSNSSEASTGCQNTTHTTSVSRPPAPSQQPAPECPICTATVTLDEGIKLLCGHIFCKDCSEAWLRDHSTCPTCRRRLYSSKPMRGCHYKIEAMDGRVLDVLRLC